MPVHNATTQSFLTWCRWEQNLEKDPLAHVAPEPSELLDRTRYLRSSRVLPEEEEALLSSVIQRLRDAVNKRGVNHNRAQHARTHALTHMFEALMR